MFGKKTRAIALLLALSMSTTQAVSATSWEQAQKKAEAEEKRVEAAEKKADANQKKVEAEKAQTQQDLASKKKEIDALEEKKQALQKEIDQMDAELIDLMVEIKTLKADISDKEDEIKDTKAELEEAREEQDEQYQDMKTRIAYIYENGGNAAWAEMIVSNTSITDLLSKAEYTQDIYDYDREALDTYVETVSNVNELELSMEEDKAELVTMKEESEEEEEALNKALEKKKKTSANYASEIEAAEKKADQYTALIRQQTAQISKIQQEKESLAAAKRAAQEAKRKAAAEKAAAEKAAAEKAAAAKKAAAEKAAAEKAAASAKTTSASTSTASASSTSASGSSSSSTSSSSSSNASNSSASSSASEETETTVSGGSGGAVASYACRFVGNPYVWGGTSLTHGADCSGFVMSVYKHFGVSLPHSSAALRSVGRGVSYSEAKAGDIICYSGHVAIYLGGGAIVHASNKKDGIKISYNAAYRSIVAVRRIF